MRTRTMMAVMALALLAGACDAGPGEVPEGEPAVTAGDTPETAGDDAAAASDALLNPNKATSDELLSVPNLDQALADTLMAARPFDSMVEVDSLLAGALSEEQRDSVYAYLWIPIDLNSASEEEILLIPGVGDHMLHEFQEYRPYRAMAEFHREIGKYVDEAEVARLARYVMIAE